MSDIFLIRNQSPDKLWPRKEIDGFWKKKQNLNRKKEKIFHTCQRRQSDLRHAI